MRDVSSRHQVVDRHVSDLLGAGMRRDDHCVDHGVSGGRASRPQLDKAVAALEEGDTLVITTLDRLGRSPPNMLAFAEALRLIEPGEPATQVARDLGMSRATL